MKNLKKVLALVLAVVMVMGAVVTTSAAYTDVKDTDTYADAIDILSNLGILDGFTDGTFKADGTFTRAQAAKIIAVLHNAKTNGKIDTKIADLYANAQNPFVDCNNSWALPYINYCRITGLADGMTATTYEPNRVLTGVQFLKLILTTLGFDTAKEGYTGTGWDINVLNRANEVKLTAGLEKGWKAIAPVTRGEAAQIIVNALTSNLVEYGQKVKNSHDTTANVYTAAFVANEQVSATGYTLGSKMDVKCEEAHDVFMRPGYKWSYKSWSAFYLMAADATYTGKVKACDILVDLGIAKNNTYSELNYVVYRDGIGHGTSADFTGLMSHSSTICGAEVGQTGALTQVYWVTGNKVIITVIDTFLAKVNTVFPYKHGTTNGSSDLSVYMAPDYDSTTTAATPERSKFTNNVEDFNVSDLTEYAKGDYILLNAAIVANEAQNNAYATFLGGFGKPYNYDTKVYDNSTKDVYTSSNEGSQGNELALVPFQKAGTIDKAVFSGQNADRSVITVNGTKTPVNCTYTLTGIFKDAADSAILLGKSNTNFFTDQYGNVIGDSNYFVSNYAIIDGAQWIIGKDLQTASYAQFALVGTDAKTTYATVTKYRGLATAPAANGDLGGWNESSTTQVAVSEYPTWNGAFYTAANNFGVVKYTEADGKYQLDKIYSNGTTSVDVLKNINRASVKPGQVEIYTEEGLHVYASNNTQFVVRTLDAAGNHVYTPYTGIDALPAMSNITGGAAIWATKDDNFATFIYLIADNAIFAGTDVVAYVDPTALDYAEFGVVTTYTVYINGEKTTITYNKNGGETALFTDGAGLYKLHFLSGDKVVGSATKISALNGWTTGMVTDVQNNAFYLADGKGYNLTGAKVYVIGETGVAAGTAADVAATAKVAIKLVAGSDFMVDTIYVGVGDSVISAG